MEKDEDVKEPYIETTDNKIIRWVMTGIIGGAISTIIIGGIKACLKKGEKTRLSDEE